MAAVRRQHGRYSLPCCQLRAAIRFNLVVHRQSMIIRNFIPGEETELRRVFMSSVHELARGLYTPEQPDAWSPFVHANQEWENRIAALRPIVATSDDLVPGYAALQDSVSIDNF